MSIANLYKAGVKDQDLVVDNLTVNSEIQSDIISVADLELTGTFTIPNPLNLNDNVNLQKNVNIGTLAGGYSLGINDQDINLNDNCTLNIQDNSATALRILEGANKYFVCDTTNASEKVSIEKDLYLNSANLNVSNQATALKLIDNNASAFSIQEDVNNYIVCNTTNSAERVSIEKDLYLNSSNLNVSNQATNIKLLDNDPSSLAIQQGANNYIICDTTNSFEKVIVAKDLHMQSPNIDFTNQSSVLNIGLNDATALSVNEDVTPYMVFNSVTDAEKISVYKNLSSVFPAKISPVAGEVSQLTNINTGVSSDTQCTLITTQSASTAGLGNDAFTFTNSYILATSKVIVSLNDYSGTYTTNGLPVVSANALADGSCNIVISNCHATNALSGTFKIAVSVF